MKCLRRLIIINMIFIILAGVNNLAYATDRFVDIPIPSNSSGKADFTSEDGEKEAEQYKENKTTNNIREEYIKKSGNNYLKNLRVEGYKLEPQFNMQEDEYIMYVPDISKVTSLNVIAEPDDIKATTEGTGNISITEDTNIININVIAENGNLKVYTIQIKNQAQNQKQDQTQDQKQDQTQDHKADDNSRDIIIVIAVIISIIILVGIFKNKKSKKS